MKSFLEELRWRGLLYDTTPGLAARLNRGSITGYVGFDPTAQSLQIGNLVPVMLLAHLQRAGGKPIVVIGGGTGLIGDPSGKRSERPLLDLATVQENADRQRAELSKFLDFGNTPTGAIAINNAEWLTSLDLVSFLRDIGKHFTLSHMLQKESVRARMEAGISFTEFTYMLMQAYDFLHLYKNFNCELQMGGSDQWGNITAGVELIRRITAGQAHGLAAPLVTTSTGSKFGKTEAGGVWLNPAVTSPYKFYQFWINVDDRDVEDYLKMFTFKTSNEIAGLMEQHQADASSRVPHKELALDVTARAHGSDAARSAAEASRLIFHESDLENAATETWETLESELPSWETSISAFPMPIVDLLVKAGLTKSKGEARRQLQQGGIYVNDQRVAPDTHVDTDRLLIGRYLWLRRGKKTDVIVKALP